MARFAQGYRRIFGGARSPLQLYGGFTAFFAGFAMGLFGILIALSGDWFIEEIWQRRGIGITIAALGLPLLFMGIQLTMPSRFFIQAVAGLGFLVCVVGVVLFNQAWPHEWNRPDADRSGGVIAVYVLGLVLVFVTTGLALILNFIARIMALPGQEHEVDVFAGADRRVTMQEVLRDIEREVARQRLTWGGLEEDRLPREFVKIGTGFGPGTQVSSGKAGTVTQTSAREMDTAFEALARLRGIEGKKVLDDDDTATAIEALRALRRARQAELEASWWYRFKRWLVRLFTGEPDTSGPRGPVPRSVTVIPAAHRKNPKVETGTSTTGPRPAPAKRPKAVKRSVPDGLAVKARERSGAAVVAQSAPGSGSRNGRMGRPAARKATRVTGRTNKE